MWIKANKDEVIYLCQFYYNKLIYSWDDLVQHTDIISSEFSKRLENQGYIWVDEGIADFVAYLNKIGYKTVASCSGHRHYDYHYENQYDFYVMVESKDVKWEDFKIPRIAINYNKEPKPLVLDGGTRFGFNFTSYYSSNMVLNMLNSCCNYLINPRYAGYSLDDDLGDLPEDLRNTFILSKV